MIMSDYEETNLGKGMVSGVLVQNIRMSLAKAIGTWSKVDRTLIQEDAQEVILLLRGCGFATLVRMWLILAFFEALVQHIHF